MDLNSSVTGWFAPTYTTGTVLTTSTNIQPYYIPQHVVEPPEPRPLSPLEWLRSRVGEYVEAGALA